MGLASMYNGEQLNALVVAPPRSRGPSVPTVAEIFQLAVQYHQAGQLPQAEQLYHQVTQADPQHVQAVCNLGVIAMQSGWLERAMQWYQQAITIDPNFGEGHFNLANAYSRTGQLEAAAASYRETVRLRPTLSAGYVNLGRTLVQLGRLEEGLAAFEQNLKLDPKSAEAHTYIANAKSRLGRQEEAFAELREALRLNPECAEAYYSLASMQSAQGKLDDVEKNLRQVVAIRPNFVEAHNNLGITLEAQGKLDEAASALQQALYWNPNFLPAYTNLGLVRLAQGKLEDATHSLNEALRLKPDFMAAHSNLLLVLNYDPKIGPRDLLEAHREWERRHARVAPLGPAPDLDRSPDRKLRIGYVSPNFSKHPVAAFIEPILANHDPQQVEAIGYAEAPIPDATTERLKGLASGWCPTAGMTDEQVAQRIRADRIDILVDLAGHAGSSRLRVFAFKPAPVQVTYLGYPNTTGLTAIDYQLTDAVIDPPGDEAYHSEQLARLPGCFCCYAPPPDAPPVAPSPARRQGFVTFGSPHNLAKLNANVLDLWAKVLRAVPTSRLLIFRHTLGGSTKQELLRQLVQRGVAAERIEMRSRLEGSQDFLHVYDHFDLTLDVFPWCGHTTACESLWMGVPIVTLYGARRAGRMVASVLRSVGLPELIAETPEQYVARAVEWAGNPDKLAELRGQLRQRVKASPLCDGKAFTHGLEEAYRTMWRRWVSA
jgi:predicted O-linked N-acetylglucosamine transferase (SPINDLY family)